MSECCKLNKFVKFTISSEKFEESGMIRNKSKSGQKLMRSLAAFSSGKKSSNSSSHHGSNQKIGRERAISGIDSQCQLSTDGDNSELQSPMGEQPKEALSWDFQDQGIQKALKKCSVQKDDGQLEFLNCKKCGALYFENVSLIFYFSLFRIL